MINYKLLQDVIQQIKDAGKLPILDRIRTMLAADDESDEERRIDLIFVHMHDEFPTDDNELLYMYMNWVDATFDL
jgi:hypothetical protein